MCISEEALMISIVHSREESILFLTERGYSLADAKVKVDRLIRDYIGKNYEEINKEIYDMSI